MSVIELIALLEKFVSNYPEERHKEVFLECGHSGGSWSIEGIGRSEGLVVITLDTFNGPMAPETEFRK